MQIMNMDGQPHETVWNDYIRADFATWEVGKDCEVHYHEDAVEIFIFLEGMCEFTAGEEMEIVRAGQAVYVGPGEPHRLKAIGDTPLKMFLFVSPNHAPTHSFIGQDGAIRTQNRPVPPPEVVWLGRLDILESDV